MLPTLLKPFILLLGILANAFLHHSAKQISLLLGTTVDSLIGAKIICQNCLAKTQFVKDMLHSFIFLDTHSAIFRIIQTSLLQPACCPTFIVDSKPNKDLTLRGCPALPDPFQRLEGFSSNEERPVGRFGAKQESPVGRFGAKQAITAKSPHMLVIRIL
jgi:hypothetical protein